MYLLVLTSRSEGHIKQLIGPHVTLGLALLAPATVWKLEDWKNIFSLCKNDITYDNFQP